MGFSEISKLALQRLPAYMAYLNSLPKDAPTHISATTIATALGLGEVQVRKDLAAVTSGGKPKVGYVVSELIEELEQFMGYKNMSEAILVGCGKIGCAVLNYRNFIQYGLKIVAGFDVDPTLAGITPSGKKILPMEKMKSLCSRMHIQLAVIAVPAEQAQAVCDELVACGIRGILNLASVHLNVPYHVIVRYENLAVELAILAGQVEAQQQEESNNN